jgi:putative hydrolase of the HAD superfamily
MSRRNVIFDFGGVLIRWKPQEIIDNFYPDQASREALRELVFQHPDWLDLDAGRLLEEDAIARFAVRLGKPPGEMQALMEHVKESLTPIEESLALVHDLAQRQVPLYGLSNMSTSVFAHLRQRYTHWDLFRGIVISGEIKLIKPDRAIFDHISQRYGLAPSQSIFIDDNPPNVEAANQLGFHTILFRDPQQCAAELAQYL